MQEAVIDTAAALASMTERAKILGGPEYFTCQRTHARIRKTECIMRQTTGVILPGSLKKEVPPECRGCEQGQVIAGEQAETNNKTGERKTMPVNSNEENERAFQEIKAACSDRRCEFWQPDGCIYQGRITKGLCIRKYHQQNYRDTVKAKRSSAHRKAKNNTGSKAQKPEFPVNRVIAEAASVQAELDAPKAGNLDAPTVVLDFGGMEDLYVDLEQAARDDLRTPELQALWLIKKGLRDDQ